MPNVYTRELEELIIVYPYCHIDDVVDSDIATRQTAAVDLKALAAEGVLKKIKTGGENLYVNFPLPALRAEWE